VADLISDSLLIGFEFQPMLCNDSDLHFSSPDLSLLLENFST